MGEGEGDETGDETMSNKSKFLVKKKIKKNYCEKPCASDFRNFL